MYIYGRQVNKFCDFAHLNFLKAPCTNRQKLQTLKNLKTMTNATIITCSNTGSCGKTLFECARENLSPTYPRIQITVLRDLAVFQPFLQHATPSLCGVVGMCKSKRGVDVWIDNDLWKIYLPWNALCIVEKSRALQLRSPSSSRTTHDRLPNFHALAWVMHVISKHAIWN